ncbi:hypothetical protein LTR24_009455 [Lithohypha guttulata]|uniref:Pre-mRNA-splicing factor 18 n=1 Tax=Lithohypha guttulata TaxID=1690604 RepID=A0ABR0JWZ0_9EURO|nr:hypothetical protein LTR24_009455 [Lithohypha guttulata]
MDFKSLMAAQISKNKPASTSTNGTSKYQRRGDAERDREAKYAQEQARLETERLERLEKKRKLEDEEAERVEAREEKRRKLAGESRVRREEREAEEERLRRKRLGLPERPPSTAADGGDDEADRPDIPDDELRTKLAGLKQPEAIENETHTERLYRYYKLTSKALKRRQWYPGPIPTTIEPLPADEILLPEKPPAPSDRDAYIKLHRQISSYLNFVLTEWSAALAGRDKDDAQSSAGIAATNNYRIALEDLKPLVRRLEAAVYNPTPKPDAPTTSTPLQHEALLIPIVQILHLTQKRHYRDAVDAYLRLSIGKAAWPIGVTMVGIHERSAREKLHEDGKNRDIAHIMSDEGTRKWLQSLKRLVGGV